MLDKLRLLMGFFQNGSSGEFDAPRQGGMNPFGDTGDSYHNFMNKVSRLPRLLLLFGAIALLVWPIVDPVGFSAWAQAVNLMPENIWMLIFIIIGSWATSKFIRDVRSPSAYTQYTHYESGYNYDYDSTEPAGRFEELTKDNDPVLLEPSMPEMNNSIQEWKQKNASE